ncbi:MAG: rod shape-determining protein RodA [Chloroflexi bacterium]|nr:rod shape-determining protein RodA [Chloroflexota bacterium]
MVKTWQHFDVPLLLTAVILMGYGLLMLYSATLAISGPVVRWLDTPVGRQGVFAVVGLAGLVIAAAVDYHLVRAFVPPFYLFILVSLVVVLATGTTVYGSRRWLELGLFQFQPSELGKIGVTLALARYLGGRAERVLGIRALAVSFLIISPPMALIYLQPDLGTVAVYLAIWLAMVFVAGVRLIYLLGLGVAGLIAVPLTYTYLLHDYMKERVATFLDPTRDPLGAGYNVLQSTISVGSGGFFGKGWTLGTQAQNNFLRNVHTDFIFSMLGEELGFVGGFVLLLLFTILLFRGIRVAGLAGDPFGKLIAVGVVTMIFCQVFVNVGVNVRLLPVTGVPLPFVSSGGSSVVTVFVGIGLLESVLMRREKPRF